MKEFAKETNQKYFMKKSYQNQEAELYMLSTGDKCGNEWKVVKNDKIKTNTKKTSA